MIQIKRPKAPAFLTAPGNRWEAETQRAIAHYNAGNTESFNFEMYNDSELKDALKKVFVKCAYCESSYGAVYDGDVEHFRPKGKVKEKTPQTPGYYWLANDWHNLFLACQHCNQRRKHVLVGAVKAEGYGKLDQFPIVTEKRRAHAPDLLKAEDSSRLLINPCKDDPTRHLAYDDKEGVIIPLTAKGKKSVEVYVLQRPFLVQERKKTLIRLFEQIGRVKRELERFNKDHSAEQKEYFEKEFEALIEFTKPESVYAGMCRFFVKQFIAENGLN